MGATSVTGKGQGMSNGKQKPENNCGCGCCGKPDETTPSTPSKSYCSTTVRIGGKSSLKVGRATGTKVCA